MPTSRPLRVACIAVDDRWVYVSDDTFPVVAQIDRTTGDLNRLVWWEVCAPCRGRRASTALLTDGGDLWISSPAAGGVVRIDTATGQVSHIALDEAPGPITATEGAIWIAAEANWANYEGGATRTSESQVLPRRPIVVADPVIVPTSMWFAARPRHEEDTRSTFDDDAGVGAPVFADDEFGWDSARPFWRIIDGVAELVDVGGDVQGMVHLEGDDLLVVLRRSDDPVVVTPHGRGSFGFSYPGVLVRCAPPALPVVLTELPNTGGSLIADGERYWLAGFGFESPSSTVHASTPFAADAVVLQELDVATNNLTVSSITFGPDAIVDNFAVALEYTHESPFGGRRTGSEAICVAPDQPIFWLNPSDGTTGLIAIDIDLGEGAPAPVPPPGIELEQHEESQLELIRAGLLGGLRDQEGNVHPLVRGVEFDSVERHGSFPDSHVVARFRSVGRPGVLFARRWNLYDELGNALTHEDAEVSLSEDIEAPGWGLPPLDECHPDDDGLVWF